MIITDVSTEGIEEETPRAMLFADDSHREMMEARIEMEGMYGEEWA